LRGAFLRVASVESVGLFSHELHFPHFLHVTSLHEAFYM
jgi:hypothetical protein